MTRGGESKRGALKRGAWTIADQGICSVGNVLLSVAVAHVASARGFGAFSFAYLAFTLVLALSRSIGSDVLVVRFTGTGREEMASAASDATGVAVVTGLLGSAVLLAAAAIAGTSSFGVGIVIAAALPFLLVQDCIRYAWFAAGRARSAAFNDALWLGIEAVGFALLIGLGRASTISLTAVWVLGGAAAACSGLRSLRLRPSPRRAERWVREHRSFAGPFCGECLIANGAPFIGTLAIGAIVGLPGVAALRGAQVLFGPITTLDLAFTTLLVPEGVRVARTSPRRLTPLMAGSSGIFAAAAAVWAIVVLALPPAVGAAVLGNTWGRAREVVIPIAFVVAGNGLKVGATAGLRAIGAAAAGFATRLALAPVVIAASVLGAIAGGAPGAAYGQAIAGFAGAVLWWRVMVSRNAASRITTPRTRAARGLA